MKNFFIIALIIFFTTPFSYGEEYLWGNEKSQVFLPGTNADDVYKLFFAARTRITMGEYAVNNKGHKITYVDKRAVTEIQTDKLTLWSFILPFDNESGAFNFFFDIQNQLNLFIPVYERNNEFNSIFKDGEFSMTLIGNATNIIISTID